MQTLEHQLHGLGDVELRSGNWEGSGRCGELGLWGVRELGDVGELGSWGAGDVGSWELGSWGAGDVGSWELGSWGVGELGIWGAGEGVGSC